MAVDIPDRERWWGVRLLCKLLEEFWVCVLHECRELGKEVRKQGWEGVTESVCGVDDKLWSDGVC